MTFAVASNHSISLSLLLIKNYIYTDYAYLSGYW